MKNLNLEHPKAIGTKVDWQDLPRSKILDYRGGGEDFYKFSWPINTPVIIPSHSYDLREACTDIEEINMQRVQQVSLPGGAFASVYKKKDKNKPGYIYVINEHERAYLLIEVN